MAHTLTLSKHVMAQSRSVRGTLPKDLHPPDFLSKVLRYGKPYADVYINSSYCKYICTLSGDFTVESLEGIVKANCSCSLNNIEQLSSVRTSM